MASAATRFARQAVRESQKQTAREPVLLVFVILELPGGRPFGPAAADAKSSFVSSYLRRYRGYVSVRQWI